VHRSRVRVAVPCVGGEEERAIRSTCGCSHRGPARDRRRRGGRRSGSVRGARPAVESMGRAATEDPVLFEAAAQPGFLPHAPSSRLNRCPTRRRGSKRPEPQYCCSDTRRALTRGEIVHDVAGYPRRSPLIGGVRARQGNAAGRCRSRPNRSVTARARLPRTARTTTCPISAWASGSRRSASR
jgi:hypothetical protein